jgi:hypothetical protein
VERISKEYYLLEFIAQHHLNNRSEHKSLSKDLLNISEIGVVADVVIPFVRGLNEIGIPNWRDDSEGLTPVGDENGLFIIVKSNRRWFFSNQNQNFIHLKYLLMKLGSFLLLKKNIF